ncbi:MAG: hypothetical protein ACI4GA_07445 [Acutalibacteraceae bacterium]
MAFITTSVAFLFLFCACAHSTLINIDSFLEAFSENSGSQITKEDITAFEENGGICHCFKIGDATIALHSDGETMKITSADAVTEKQPDDEYKNTVRLMVESLTDMNENNISRLVSEMTATNGGFSRSSYQTHNYTLKFISVDAGSKFSVFFNELVPTETTKIPATQREFEEYSTIPEFTG